MKENTFPRRGKSNSKDQKLKFQFRFSNLRHENYLKVVSLWSHTFELKNAN